MSVILQGLLRHFLTLAGGALISKGYVDATQVTEITGAVVALAGVGLSVWDKKKRK